MTRPAFAFLVIAASCAPAPEGGPEGRPAPPEVRAAEYLAREVPGWEVKNRCFSCHNNGDAARALYAARRRSIPFDVRSLETTTRWLLRPEEWKENGPEGIFSDKKLAMLQFAFALTAAVETGAADGRKALVAAAEKVRESQEPEGFWNVDAGGLPGSPVTYGRTLGTVAARRVLSEADPSRFRESIARADAWLRQQRPKGVLDAAAVLLGLPSGDHEELATLRRACLEVLRKGQTSDGGWGPYTTSPPEVFDTSVAILALATIRQEEGVPDMIRCGRRFLTASQEADGGWPETTRPTGGDSYAQRISTTAWALLALLSVTQS